MPDKWTAKLLKEFSYRFPHWKVTKYAPINHSKIKIWVGNWVFIFWYESPTQWSVTTLKGWERQLKTEEVPFND